MPALAEGERDRSERRRRGSTTEDWSTEQIEPEYFSQLLEGGRRWPYYGATGKGTKTRLL